MSRITVAYGESGATKTSQIKPIAHYLARKHKKRLLLITGDGGGATPIQHEIDSGLVEVFDLNIENAPMGVLRNVLQGKDKRVDLKRYAGVALEGLTSISNLCLRVQTAQGRKISQDPVGLFVEEGQKFSAAAPSLYGLVQQFMLDILNVDLRHLPDNIKRIYVTAHEQKSADTNTETIYTPALCGSKAGPAVGPSVGDMLHLDKIKVGETVDKASGRKVPTLQPVAWFVSHPDERTGIFYQAKSRCPTSSLPALKAKYPNGYIPLTLDDKGEFTSSIADYFEFLDSQIPPAEGELARLVASLEV